LPCQPLNDVQFTKLARLAYDHWGLELLERKRVLVDNRISKLMSRGAYANLDDLLNKATRAGDGLRDLFDVLSTNHTGFYRESAHFDCLLEEIIRPAAKEEGPGAGRLRIWSAACSNGSEPYTMAMVLHDHLPNIAEKDVRILATDLSDSALVTARRGIYPGKAVRDLPRECLSQHFVRNGEHFAVAPHLRKLVTFGVVNLIAPWKMTGPFDAIFCRNVMIYFDAPTKRLLVERLRDMLTPGKLLFVGSSESLMGRVEGLKMLSPGAYRRVD